MLRMLEVVAGFVLLVLFVFVLTGLVVAGVVLVLT
jgi:hypothetical protein